MGLITERKVRNYYGVDADKASIPAGGKTTGDHYFTTDTKVIYRWDGGAWVGPVPGLWVTAAMLAADSVETLKILDANVTLAKLAADAKPVFGKALLHVQDQKPAGTMGGACAGGIWETRVLNTVVTNEIAGASLGANQITLPAGTYFVFARAPSFRTNSHRAKLYNVTDVADILIGGIAYTGSGGNYTQTDTFIAGRFTLAVGKVIEIRHQGQLARAADGFGTTIGMGVIEIYTDVEVWKIA